MPCHCCNRPPPELHTPQGNYGQLVRWDYFGYRKEVLPGIVTECRYSSMAGWELAIARRQWPNDPFLYIEYARRTPGHLEGSSRDGQLLDNEPLLRKFLCSDEGPGEDASLSKKGKEPMTITSSLSEREHLSEGSESRPEKEQSPSAAQPTRLSKRSFSQFSSPEQLVQEAQADAEKMDTEDAMPIIRGSQAPAEQLISSPQTNDADTFPTGSSDLLNRIMSEPQLDVEALAKEHLQIFRATIPKTPQYFDCDAVRAESSNRVPRAELPDPVLASPEPLNPNWFTQNPRFRNTYTDDAQGLRIELETGETLRFTDWASYAQYVEFFAEDESRFYLPRRRSLPEDGPSVPTRPFIDSDSVIDYNQPDIAPNFRQRSMSMEISIQSPPCLASPRSETASNDSRNENVAMPTPELTYSDWEQPRVFNGNDRYGDRHPESSEDSAISRL
ncbi:hypothetical protein DL98DRAFT_529049 [Cadophora sp. DSE1049]|nr:hypothetical protein DL98DRAFT_529049 [Cadophora sp. DSE1049]